MAMRARNWLLFIGCSVIAVVAALSVMVAGVTRSEQGRTGADLVTSTAALSIAQGSATTTISPAVPTATIGGEATDCNRNVRVVGTTSTLVDHLITLLSTKNVCIGYDVEVATKMVVGGTWVALVNPKNVNEVREPFAEAIYVFFITGRVVDMQSEFDGTLEYLGELAQ